MTDCGKSDIVHSASTTKWPFKHSTAPTCSCRDGIYLVQVVRRCHALFQPHRIPRTFPKFDSIRRSDERDGDAVDCSTLSSFPDEVTSCRDVTPLVGTPQLYMAIVCISQMQKIVRLQYLCLEFEVWILKLLSYTAKHIFIGL